MTQSIPVAPPARLRESILTRIASTPQEEPDPHQTDASALRSSVDVSDNFAADETVDQRPGHRAVVELRRRTRRPVLVRRIPYLVAAVALLIAFTASLWGWQSYRTAARADRQQQLISRLISSPDSVSRTASTPGGGRGAVIFSEMQQKAIFVGTDLPAPSGSQVYQLWTITDVPKSAGLITSTDSTVVVTLPQAALTARSVAVTVEKQGGSSTPTGNPVMSFRLS
ncbi:anti-sigma factor [Microlunatus endophyticus]|uniref:anti-sigma factor n=1 Tax=Microlunatus endophyticus TaxID=1716077 RepID=UPI001667CC6F|nr:anti-sigma factor [Microlunatus endophyticus]